MIAFKFPSLNPAGHVLNKKLGFMFLFCGWSFLLLTQPACNSSKLEPVSLSPRQSQEVKNLQHYEITLKDLPPPHISYDVNNPSQIIARPDGAQLFLPPGFEISLFAEGDLNHPRWMALAPNGDVFIAESFINRITILRDQNQDGVADERFTFVTGLVQPFGMVFQGNSLYVANTDSVVRFSYALGQTKANWPPETIFKLPGYGYNQHWTRNLAFSPDGKKLYVTVGSTTNVDVEQDSMRAAITEYNPDGSGKRIFAGGLRNPVGLVFNPTTGKLWTSVNERDRLGDDLVPDYITEVKDGAFYGWPYAYLGPQEDPNHKNENPELVKQTIPPDVLIQAHSAALGFVFYTGGMFPQDYVGDAFVALHGSWNRSNRTGYKIIRVKFRDGRPVGGYDDFVKGWMLDKSNPKVWGRPVGLLVLKDGSLLIADDGANKIWRVSYRTPHP